MRVAVGKNIDKVGSAISTYLAQSIVVGFLSGAHEVRCETRLQLSLCLQGYARSPSSPAIIL